jgi:hypothetical protein
MIDCTRSGRLAGLKSSRTRVCERGRSGDFLRAWAIGRLPAPVGGGLFLLCTFVSFVVNEVQMLEPRRTQRYTKEPHRNSSGVPLGHVDGFPELNFSLTAGRRFFSLQLCGDAQRLYFLLNSDNFLLFHSKHFQGIFHWGTPSSSLPTSTIHWEPTLDHPVAARNITKVHI